VQRGARERRLDQTSGLDLACQIFTFEVLESRPQTDEGRPRELCLQPNQALDCRANRKIGPRPEQLPLE
jgi:hypothetical protein